jgi:hypothetical protein
MHEERPTLVTNPDFVTAAKAHFDGRKPEMWELERFVDRWQAEHPTAGLQVSAGSTGAPALAGLEAPELGPELPNRHQRRRAMALRPKAKPAPFVPGALAPALTQGNRPSLSASETLQRLLAAGAPFDARRKARNRRKAAARAGQPALPGGGPCPRRPARKMARLVVRTFARKGTKALVWSVRARMRLAGRFESAHKPPGQGFPKWALAAERRGYERAAALGLR